MKRTSALLFVSCLSAVLLSGCVGTIDGHHRAGVPLTKDKIVARYERSPKDIWTAAKDVLNYNGVLYREDVMQATLEGSIDTRTVWVKVEQDDPKYTKLTVQARTKGGGADVRMAAEIDKQIALRLATGNLPPAKPAASAATQPPAPR
jgi:hypothetical protein